MTYGWAILIIAVVLGALFALGIFGGTGILGGATCVASPGWLCQSPTLLPTGNLSFILGQNTGATIYNVAAACSATTQTNGQPNPPGPSATYFPCASGNPGIAMVYLTSLGAATGNCAGLPTNVVPGNNALTVGGNWLANPAIGGTGLTLVSDQQVQVTGLTCFGTNPANAMRGLRVGAPFSGSIWINYTLGNAAPNPSTGNPMLEQKIGTVSLKVV